MVRQAAMCPVEDRVEDAAPPLLLLKYVAAAHRNSRRLGADGRLAPDAGRAESRYADLLPCTS